MYTWINPYMQKRSTQDSPINSFRNMLETCAHDGSIILVFSNSRYSLILDNWLAHVHKLKIKNYLVVALDHALHQSLKRRCIPSFVGEEISELKGLWRYRITLIHLVLHTGINVIHSDVDAVWLQNPLSTLIGNKRIDLVFSQGTIWPEDVHGKWGFVLCCGLFSARSNMQSIDFFDRWKLKLKEDGDDQRTLNRLLLEERVQWQHVPSYQINFRDKKVQCHSDLVHGYTEDLSIQILPHRLYQRLHEPKHSAIVKHLLSNKNQGDVSHVLQKSGCWLL